MLRPSNSNWERRHNAPNWFFCRIQWIVFLLLCLVVYADLNEELRHLKVLEANLQTKELMCNLAKLMWRSHKCWMGTINVDKRETQFIYFSLKFDGYCTCRLWSLVGPIMICDDYKKNCSVKSMYVDFWQVIPACFHWLCNIRCLRSCKVCYTAFSRNKEPGRQHAWVGEYQMHTRCVKFLKINIAFDPLITEYWYLKSHHHW